MDCRFSFLTGTALATIFVSENEIYTYAQTSDCQLVEIAGKIAVAETGCLSTYKPTGKQTLINLTKKGETTAAKRFTPLAASPMLYLNDNGIKTQRRYLFYVDCDNKLRDVFEESGTGIWNCGELNSTLHLECAPYSKLAAVKTTNRNEADFIYLYYQCKDDSGNIQLASFCHETRGWNNGDPPICDPPIWGTAITAVPTEPSIQIASSSVDPVVVFQQKSLQLSASQLTVSPDDDTEEYRTYNIDDETEELSGHAYIAAVDNGTNCWCFYTSESNDIFRVRIGKEILLNPTRIGLDRAPASKSPLAAAYANNSPPKIVLFYLLHENESSHSDGHHTKDLGKTNVYACTLTKISRDHWSVSNGRSLRN